MNSTGSISREAIAAIVNPFVPAAYNHHGVLHEQYLVDGRIHSGPRIFWWSRGEETWQSAVYFLTGRGRWREGKRKGAREGEQVREGEGEQVREGEGEKLLRK